MINLLIFLWLIVLIKKLFFWTWLWQLKNYHSSRFLAHFSTHQGKKLIFNPLNLIKLILIAWAFLGPFYIVLPIIIFVYFLEVSLIALRILKRNFKYPILTKKTIAILITGTLLIFLSLVRTKNLVSLSTFIAFILAVDVFAPVIFSFLVFCFWPITKIWQKKLINKEIKKRKQFQNLIVIGITGSYGKTSTKEFLYTILSEKIHPVKSREAGISPKVKLFNRVKVLKTKKNQNSEIGISQCILNDLNSEHKIFICEMGAYNKGGIKLLCDIAQPEIGILTGINEQHMATFGSQKNIIKTKFELIESLPDSGIAILNWDDELIKTQSSRLRQGYGGQAKLKIINCLTAEQIQDLEAKKQSISFSLQGIQFNLNLIGKQNIENLLLAIACAQELGINLSEISNACKKIKPFEKTMELKQGRGEVIIIDDTYSANPAGVFAALDYLKLYNAKKVIIMPCLIELGKAGKKVHEQIGEKIGKTCDFAIITSRDYFKQIKNSAIGAGMNQKNILFLQNPEKIFNKIKPYLQSDNVILLESRIPDSLVKKLTI